LEKIRQFSGLQSRQPLALEYLQEPALVCYYPDECVEIRPGKPEIRRPYLFNNYQFTIVKVLVDMENGQKMIVNDGDKFFSLFCDS
jgi:hypothetical protein